MGSAESCSVTDPESLGVDGNLPEHDVLTHSCLYRQHRFPLPNPPAPELLSVHWAAGSLPDPLNPALTDHYLAYAMGTGYDGTRAAQRYGRPAANVVLVVDASGSMNAHMKCKHDLDQASKYKAAREVIAGPDGLLSTLQAGDRCAVLTFNNDTKVLQDLVAPSAAVTERVAGLLEQQEPVGGTDLARAMTIATRVMAHAAAKEPRCGTETYFKDVDGTNVLTEVPRTPVDNPDAYFKGLAALAVENRIIILTDEYLGSKDDHLAAIQIAAKEAKRGVHTTFVGIGTNVPPPTAELIASFPGCTSYSAHTVQELKHFMVEEFAHTAFPAAYKANVEVVSALPPVLEAFGQVPRTAAAGGVVQQETIFPGSGGENGVHCTIGVLRLKTPLAPGTVLTYTKSHVDRSGKEERVAAGEWVVSNNTSAPWFRKAVALTRLATLLRVFLRDEHAGGGGNTITAASGIGVLPAELRATETAALEGLGEMVEEWNAIESEDAVSQDTLDMSEPDEATHSIDVEQSAFEQLQKKYGAWIGALREKKGTSPPEKPATPLHLHQDPTATRPVLREASMASLRSHGSFSLSAAGPPALPARPVPQGSISAHYRQVLNAFAEPYFAGEVAADGADPAMKHWLHFLKSIADCIREETVVAKAEAYLTEALLREGVEPDDAYHALQEAFQHRLRENHRRAVHRVFSNKMYSVLLSIVCAEVDAHDAWFVPSEAVKKEVLADVRGAFSAVDPHNWGAWTARWGALVDATLRTSLHAKLFRLAAATYEAYAKDHAHPADAGLLTQAVVAGVTAAAPEFLADPLPAAAAAQLRDLKAFLTRWIVAPLIEHQGRCRWSYDKGVPVPLDDTTPETIAQPQCPTQ
eukprot:TRINITY_DN1673_c0_g1_i1.p1 TRINITY_DN1673_c0_g1~~TRINITY_DN1673_c0_g1_i1.p1  ORF type:complete len:865 (+),score=319.57 TRINITY_DN1673_c0_g1_i1:80-2674(+)